MSAASNSSSAAAPARAATSQFAGVSTGGGGAGAAPARLSAAGLAAFTSSSLYASPAQVLAQQQQAAAAASPPVPAAASASAATGPGGTGAAGAAAAAEKQFVTSIIVGERQRGNPLLERIRNVPYTFSTDKMMLADYLLGPTACALYLSLKYHVLQPKYLLGRMLSIKYQYRTRILFCHVDLDDSEKALEDVTKLAFNQNWTLVCGWSYDEIARYLETFRLYENKSADAIKERVESTDIKAQFTTVLTTIRAVNKTDVATLASQFGSLRRIANASMEELALCPGLGHKKVKRIFNAFHQPFITSQAQGVGAGRGQTAGAAAAGGTNTSPPKAPVPNAAAVGAPAAAAAASAAAAAATPAASPTLNELLMAAGHAPLPVDSSPSTSPRSAQAALTARRAAAAAAIAASRSNDSVASIASAAPTVLAGVATAATTLAIRGTGAATAGDDDADADGDGDAADDEPPLPPPPPAKPRLFRLAVQNPYFEQLRSRRKTVEGRLFTEARALMKAGDTIVFSLAVPNADGAGNGNATGSGAGAAAAAAAPASAAASSSASASSFAAKQAIVMIDSDDDSASTASGSSASTAGGAASKHSAKPRPAAAATAAAASSSSASAEEFCARVTRVMRYTTFRNMLELEGVQRCIPDSKSTEEAEAVYRRFYSVEDERKHGVMAIRVEPTDEVPPPLRSRSRVKRN